MYEEDWWLLVFIFLIFVVFISGLVLRAAARSRYRRDNAYEPWHGRLAAAEAKPRHHGKRRGWVSGVLLSLVALAAIAAGAIFFWPGWPDNKLILRISATFRDIRAGQQQQTTSRIEAINDKAAAEKFLAQTPGTTAINDSPAAEDQFMVLSGRLSTLQQAMTRILRDNAGLAQQLKATQTQITEMAQDKVALAEQLRATQTQLRATQTQLKATQTQITQMAQDNASVAEQLKAMTRRRDNASTAEKLQGSRENMAGALAQDSGESLHSKESLRPQAPLPQPNPTPAIPNRRQNVMRNWF
jgi:hypothetical protein